MYCLWLPYSAGRPSRWALAHILVTVYSTSSGVHVRSCLCVWQPDVGTEQLPDDERQKFEKEFGEYQEKLDRAKEEYVTSECFSCTFCNLMHQMKTVRLKRLWCMRKELWDFLEIFVVTNERFSHIIWISLILWSVNPYIWLSDTKAYAKSRHSTINTSDYFL